MSVVHAANAVKNRRKTEAAPIQVADGTWSMRLRQSGEDVWVKSLPSAKAAKAAAYAELAARTGRAMPHGKGPSQSLAAALCEYAGQTFKFKKGAPQEIRRLNVYLRAAGMHTLVASRPREAVKGVHFDIGLQPWSDERKIPSSLKAYRRALETKSANSNRMRAVLATKPVNKITRQHVQGLVNKLRAEGCSAATVYQEIAILKRFFNFVQTTWAWPLFDNPATHLDMEQVDNERKRVLSKQEQKFFDEALIECKNQQAALAVKLLLHTAMRASEPLTDLRWGDVNWTKSTLRLRDAKTNARNVPLSQEAMAVLHEMGPGEPDAKIFELTYEALKASFQRVCTRAGIEDMHLQDLRHTAATRFALKTGNAFLVRVLTGHKTLEMVDRYVNLDAEDAVPYLNAPDSPVDAVPSRLRSVKSPAGSSMASLGAGDVVDAEVNHGAGISPEMLAAIVQSAVAAALAAQNSVSKGVPVGSNLRLAA